MDILKGIIKIHHTIDQFRNLLFVGRK